MSDLYIDEGSSLYQSLTDNRGELTHLVHLVPHEQFSLIPSNYQMMLTEQALYMARNREHKLKGLFEKLDTQFDWLLIDCPPNLGNLTDNALNAARSVLIPIQAEKTSVRALELLFDQIESLEQGLKITVDIIAVVPNLVQDSVLSKRILSDLRTSIPAVTPFELRKRVVLQEAYDVGRSIFTYQAGRAKVDDCNELKALYTQLAEITTQHRSIHHGR